MQASLLLLRQLHATLGLVQHTLRRTADSSNQPQAEQLLHGVLVQQRAPQLLTQLLLWLQQQADCLHLEQGASTVAAAAGEAEEAAAAAEQPPISAALLWQECVACVVVAAQLTAALSDAGSNSAVDFAGFLTVALQPAGELQRTSRQCNG